MTCTPQGDHFQATPSPNMFPATTLADMAVSALLEEATLTPKPALADWRGCGAHHDLSVELLYRSAVALRPTFLQLALTAEGRVLSPELRMEIGAIGREGERAMFAVTGGANTHRGAIWSLGLLVAGAAMMLMPCSPQKIALIAGAVARIPDLYSHSRHQENNGARVCVRYRVAGAKGEATECFPHVINVGLPVLRRARATGASERHARLDTLVSIMASLDDTCLLHRGGPAALEAAKAGAKSVLLAGGSSTLNGWLALRRLDETLLSCWASPGGSADLLAATLFLDKYCQQTTSRPNTQHEELSWKG